MNPEFINGPVNYKKLSGTDANIEKKFTYLLINV